MTGSRPTVQGNLPVAASDAYIVVRTNKRVETYMITRRKEYPRKRTRAFTIKVSFH